MSSMEVKITCFDGREFIVSGNYKIGYVNYDDWLYLMDSELMDDVKYHDPIIRWNIDVQAISILSAMSFIERVAISCSSLEEFSVHPGVEIENISLSRSKLGRIELPRSVKKSIGVLHVNYFTEVEGIDEIFNNGKQPYIVFE